MHSLLVDSHAITTRLCCSSFVLFLPAWIAIGILLMTSIGREPRKWLHLSLLAATDRLTAQPASSNGLSTCELY